MQSYQIKQISKFTSLIKIEIFFQDCRSNVDQQKIINFNIFLAEIDHRYVLNIYLQEKLYSLCGIWPNSNMANQETSIQTMSNEHVRIRECSHFLFFLLIIRYLFYFHFETSWFLSQRNTGTEWCENLKFRPSHHTFLRKSRQH